MSRKTKAIMVRIPEPELPHVEDLLGRWNVSASVMIRALLASATPMQMINALAKFHQRKPDYES